MDEIDAVAVLSALAQATRLSSFRRLAEHEPDGIAAGALARVLGVPQNTLSNHLNVLSRAGLISGMRNSRSIIYRANVDRLNETTRFLLDRCCGGRPELCLPVHEGELLCCAEGDTSQ